MKLDAGLRRIMLLETEYIFIHFDQLFDDDGWLLRLPVRFIGELLQVSEQDLKNSVVLTPTELAHIKALLEHLTSFPLGTKFDKRTNDAFSKAKTAVTEGIKPENAWPKWYVDSEKAKNLTHEETLEILRHVAEGTRRITDAECEAIMWHFQTCDARICSNKQLMVNRFSSNSISFAIRMFKSTRNDPSRMVAAATLLELLHNLSCSKR